MGIRRAAPPGTRVPWVRWTENIAATVIQNGVARCDTAERVVWPSPVRPPVVAQLAFMGEGARISG